MKLRTLSILLLSFLLLAPSLLADEVPSAPGMRAAAQGERLLDQGDVEGAARVYAQAARAAPKNVQITDRAMVLRRVVSLRRYAAKGPTTKRWATTTVALHAFYLAEDLPALALDIATKAYEHAPDARTSVMVAEAMMALGKDTEAAALLAARPSPSAHERILHGVALARLGHPDAAKGLAGAVKLPADAHPALQQDLARLKARLGERAATYALLKTSFEKTPVAALPAARARVSKSPDFAGLRSERAFQDVLRTASKVKQTCSGGSSCGSCPNRGRCGK